MPSPYVELFLTVFAALFSVTNPLGNAAIFQSITEHNTPAERRSQAFRGSLYMFALLVVFFLGGTLIMDFFGITLAGIRIAGGLVIVKIGFNLLTPKTESTHTAEEHAEASTKPDIAFSPLAMPLLAGPGAIATVISISSGLPSHNALNLGVCLAGILLVCIACWLILRESGRLMKFLGVNGANALTKIMGFILLCIGVQFVVDGAIPLLAKLHG